jgi:hypothetical protein
MAIPMSAEMTLFDTDLILATSLASCPLKYRSITSSPFQLTRRLCSLGMDSADASAALKSNAG